MHHLSTVSVTGVCEGVVVSHSVTGLEVPVARLLVCCQRLHQLELHVLLQPGVEPRERVAAHGN